MFVYKVKDIIFCRNWVIIAALLCVGWNIASVRHIYCCTFYGIRIIKRMASWHGTYPLTKTRLRQRQLFVWEK